ncbi:ribonuclease PH [Hypnocyclicus thermotrophus]|uniref:Ribonuclease PH n=1 Tax=Hypnocyclicus thermotrophus TaxID=1627895 RepID=A0AA46DZR4_9FUSO|nr:ribonuclease PH [Hypnocyclicus thermotrophus]TDT71883.1 ribonuclease PH [Hypnocyclicus thermotrophus]
MKRDDGRTLNQLRKIKVTPNFIKHAEGSVLIECGETKVICNATVNENVPPFLRGKGTGWITAEYSMLPRATEDRNMRESVKGKLSGRTMEIQRLIGRSLRACIDLEQLGERTVILDCDVIQADGGTRTTSITGAYIALEIAIKKLLKEKKIKENPLKSQIAAISVGINKGQVMLDLKYTEDSTAEVDMNVIMNDKGELIEIQGTGEEATFTREELNQMLNVAEEGLKQIFELQKKYVEEAF